jgi:hypothetical protein
MTLKPLAKSEFLILSHFAEKAFLSPEDCVDQKQYNLTADLALELYRRGLLLSESTKPYRPNKTRADVEFLQIGPLRPSPGAVRILNQGYAVHVTIVLIAYLVSTGLSLGLIDLLR